MLSPPKKFYFTVSFFPQLRNFTRFNPLVSMMKMSGTLSAAMVAIVARHRLAVFRAKPRAIAIDRE
jgi:hypothetical protein